MDEPASRVFEEHVHLLTTQDWNGFNAGVFPIRVSAWSAELLAAVVAFRTFQPDAELPFAEQSAMDQIVKGSSKYSSRTVNVPQRWFNAYMSNEGQEPKSDQVHPGDFLIHFAGVGDRDKHMTWWSDLSEKKLPGWNPTSGITLSCERSGNFGTIGRRRIIVYKRRTRREESRLKIRILGTQW